VAGMEVLAEPGTKNGQLRQHILSRCGRRTCQMSGGIVEIVQKPVHRPNSVRVPPPGGTTPRPRRIAVRRGSRRPASAGSVYAIR